MNEYLNVEIIEEYIRNNGLTKRSFCEQCKISISTYIVYFVKSNAT